MIERIPSMFVSYIFETESICVSLPCRISVWCPYLCFLDSISSGAVYGMGVAKARACKFLFDKTNPIQQQQH